MEAARSRRATESGVYPNVNRNARISSTVLDRIVATKRDEVAALKRQGAALREAAEAAPPVADFEAALRAGPCVGLIAEIKRRSPSAGGIREGVSAEHVARVYAAAGVAAISVLTDREHFGGDITDLRSAAAAVTVPLLRKDFVIDAAQIHEARTAGASAVLLIVRILTDAELRDLLAVAAAIGLGGLVEVHDEAELERALAAGARVVGINNRDLGTFHRDLDTTLRLAPLVPADRVVVAESGIRDAADVARVAAAGAHAVLVGEALMRAADPSQAARSLSSVRRPFG
jgi:indole-3-glycerol phosphate synthase